MALRTLIIRTTWDWTTWPMREPRAGGQLLRKTRTENHTFRGRTIPFRATTFPRPRSPTAQRPSTIHRATSTRQKFLSWCCREAWRGRLQRAPEISPSFSTAETERARTPFLEMWGPMTASAKVQWRLLKIWAFDLTRATAEREGEFCISCFQVQATAGRARWTKLIPKGRNCCKAGRA